MAAAAPEIQPLHLVWHPFFISNRFLYFSPFGTTLAPNGTNQSFATLVRYERCKRTQEFEGLLELYDDPVIFFLNLLLFYDCVRQRDILHLRSQIQQFLYVRKFSHIVGLSCCYTIVFQFLKNSDP